MGTLCTFTQFFYKPETAKKKKSINKKSASLEDSCEDQMLSLVPRT